MSGVGRFVGVCQRAERCVLADGHRGKCQLGEMAEVEYEVEAILEQRQEYFLVKWKGWPREDSTWETESALEGCPKVLAAWRAKQAGGKARAGPQKSTAMSEPRKKPSRKLLEHAGPIDANSKGRASDRDRQVKKVGSGRVVKRMKVTTLKRTYQDAPPPSVHTSHSQGDDSRPKRRSRSHEIPEVAGESLSVCPSTSSQERETPATLHEPSQVSGVLMSPSASCTPSVTVHAASLIPPMVIEKSSHVSGGVSLIHEVHGDRPTIERAWHTASGDPKSSQEGGTSLDSRPSVVDATLVMTSNSHLLTLPKVEAVTAGTSDSKCSGDGADSASQDEAACTVLTQDDGLDDMEARSNSSRSSRSQASIGVKPAQGQNHSQSVRELDGFHGAQHTDTAGDSVEFQEEAFVRDVSACNIGKSERAPDDVGVVSDIDYEGCESFDRMVGENLQGEDVSKDVARKKAMGSMRAAPTCPASSFILDCAPANDCASEETVSAPGALCGPSVCVDVVAPSAAHGVSSSSRHRGAGTTAVAASAALCPSGNVDSRGRRRAPQKRQRQRRRGTLVFHRDSNEFEGNARDEDEEWVHAMFEEAENAEVKAEVGARDGDADEAKEAAEHEVDESVKAIAQSAEGGMSAVMAVIEGGDGATTSSTRSPVGESVARCTGNLNMFGGSTATLAENAGCIGRPEISWRRSSPDSLCKGTIAGPWLLSLRGFVGEGQRLRPASPTHGNPENGGRRSSTAAALASGIVDGASTSVPALSAGRRRGRPMLLKRGPPLGWRSDGGKAARMVARNGRSERIGGHGMENARGSFAGTEALALALPPRRRPNSSGAPHALGKARGGRHAPPSRASNAVGADGIGAERELHDDSDSDVGETEESDLSEDDKASRRVLHPHREAIERLHASHTNSLVAVASLSSRRAAEWQCFDDAPLLAYPYDAGQWNRPLPAATVVPFSKLPTRPPGVPSSAYCRGWQPVGFDWQAAGAVGTGMRGCEVCDTDHSERGNELLLCDEAGCDNCFHMSCLDPPLTRMPRRGVWLCPPCVREKKEAAKKEREAERLERRRAIMPVQEVMSAYEKERLDNIARNKEALAQLGLA